MIDMDYDSIPLGEGKTITASHLCSLLTFRLSDSVVVGGTLIEGIGTSQSDLDIYVIGDSPYSISEFPTGRYVEIIDKSEKIIEKSNIGAQVYSTYDYFENSGIHIDVKYITESEVLSVFDGA